jgi:hypothetical protein
MSIELKCPQGHRLKLKDSMAGMTGRCPLCKSLVHVPKPQPQPQALSEEAILDFLGPSPDLTDKSITDTIHDFGDSVIMRGSAIHHTPHKICAKCNREMPMAMHICPHCHTYSPDIGQ